MNDEQPVELRRVNRGRPLSQQEVARVLGISRSRVYALERRALRKLARSPVLRQLFVEALITDH